MADVPENGSGKHLVIVVHGIRDHGEWMNELRPCLEEAGFTVEVAGYEFVDLLRFLFPFDFFRQRAIDRVWTHIQYAAKLHPDAKHVSVIAHSFGTYIISRILDKEISFNAHRLIFCGSIADARLPLPRLAANFSKPILNEIGTRDIWPVLAQSVTWGYGSVGRLGFKQPGVDDCFHNRFGHGDFLNQEFCRTHWVPFLKEGKVTHAAEPIERVPWWLTLLVVVRLKHVLVLLLAYLALHWWCMPGEITVESVGGSGARFMGANIRDAITAAEQPCNIVCSFTRLRYGAKRVNRINDESLSNLYACSADAIQIKYREGLDGLTRLREVVPCLDVKAIGSDRVDVSVRDSDTILIRGTNSGKQGWICKGGLDCSTAVRASLDRN